MYLFGIVSVILPFLAISTSAAEFSWDRPQHPVFQNGKRPDVLSEDLTDVVAKSPLLTLHKALCDVESISNNEHAVSELLASYLEAHNFTVTTQKVLQPDSSDIKKKRYNVIALPKPSSKNDEVRKSGPKVILTSHIDTVPPFLPYKLSVPAGIQTKPINRSEILISGRGTVDAKACVATQIHAVLELLDQNTHSTHPTVPASDLGLVFVVGEEAVGDGMLHFSKSKLHHDLAKDYETVIFGEPTEGKLASGHKGVMKADLVARGKAAHSGYPWLGRSANSLLIPALMVLDKLGDVRPEEGGLARSEKYGNSTVNVGLIRGGVAANVVAERAEASVLFRLAGGTIEEARDVVKNALEGLGYEGGKGPLELGFSQGYGPVGLDSDVEGFESMTVNYGTDVPNLDMKTGVKRYLYGPGSILVAHSDHERLTVGDLEEAVEGYKTLILHALGK